jgi:cytoskeleton protein RodZ
MSRELGDRLKQVRQESDLSLQQVAEVTHIKLRYLEALEAGDLELLPSPAQVRGFLRIYADQLNLDPGPLLELLEPTAQAQAAPVIIYSAQPTEPLMEGDDTPPAGAQEMLAVGEKLNQQRELLGLTLEDVERHTHLRKHYLQSLEAGAFEELPSPVQGRGMLKNYALFLGMDPDPLLLQFADALQSQHAARQPERAQSKLQMKKPRAVSPLRRFLSGDLLLTGGIILGLLVLVIWGVFQISSIRGTITPTPTSMSVAEALIPDQTATPSLEPTPELTTPIPPGTTGEAAVVEEPSPTLLILNPGAQQDPIQILVTIQQRAWLRVTVDGQIEFEGYAAPGGAYSFSGMTRVELLTGNGAGISVIYNQQNLGPLGSFGEVVQRIFTTDGFQTPTPSITPTSTVTPLSTPVLDIP